MGDATKKTPVEELEGRALDAAVAEEVFSVQTWPHERKHLKKYHADISAAWLILTEVDWFKWSVSTVADLGYVVCRIDPSMSGWSSASGDTAPEAICRAALKAVRTKHPGRS